MKTPKALSALLLLTSLSAEARRPLDGDLIEDLFPQTPIVKDINVLAPLTSGTAARQPWTGRMQTVYSGALSMRAKDPEFPNSQIWKENFDYCKQKPSSSVPREHLSPAEKYDLLVGDPAYNLTNYYWNQGESYLEQYGNVPTWMSLNHGLSAASIHSEEPLHDVKVAAPNGEEIIFTADDMKALLTALWAKASPPTDFMGYRCDTPSDDRAHCNDNNPASFHLALVNSMSFLKTNLVMDAATGPDVFNYPIYSYELTYFNPMTKEESSTMENSLVSTGNSSLDPYWKTRSTQARHFVGVRAQVTYVTGFTQIPDSSDAGLRTVEFVYDLEIDAQNQVIGGEWHTKEHPDFMWKIKPGRVAATASDSKLSPKDWNGHDPLPLNWREYAQKEASKGAPIKAIIDRLVELSRK